MSHIYDDLVDSFVTEEEAWTIIAGTCHVIRTVGQVSRAMLTEDVCAKAGISHRMFQGVIDSLIDCRIIYEYNGDLIWLREGRH